MNPALPLAGLNIAVTRPREQAAQLAQLVEQAGGKVILFPLLEIAPAEDPLALRALVARLHEFDLAIFISPNAVRYGIEAIRDSAGERVGRASAKGGENFLEAARHVGLKPGLRIATVGQGSAKALRELGVANVIAPQEHFDSEALLALPELQNVGGSRVIIFRGNGGRELLGDTLAARGATVEYAECYRRLKPQQDGAALLAAAPDAITVTSSEALNCLWDMFDEAGRKRLAAVPLFAPHRRIAEAAHKLGWESASVTEAGDDGILSGLVAWAGQRKSP